MRAAREAGDLAQAMLAIRVLVFGHWDRVVRRVALKVPREDVESLASDVIYSAIQSAFDGCSVGEFVAWLNTITARRIADHHRRREAMPSIMSVEGEAEGHRSFAGPADAPPDGFIATRDVVERVIASLSDEHARVVERHVLDGVPARDVAGELGIGAGNVAQIASRFRRRLREHLQTSEDP